MLLPLLFVGGGVAALLAFAAANVDRPIPDHVPDEPAAPGTTGYRHVDAILGELRKAAEASKVPLGLLVGWIAKESGGRLSEVTKKFDERGYFQIMPVESAALVDPETGRKGLDHQRLSTDSRYSINAGLLLIGKYMRLVDSFGVTPKGSSYYWKLVKLCHAMGSSATGKVVDSAREAGQSGTWSVLEKYALDNDAALKAATKHSAKKWFPFVDEVAQIGKPFGFGDDQTVVGGYPVRAPVFTDIPDPLDVIQPRSV